MTSHFMNTVEEGTTVRLRNGSFVVVEFIADMPDDLHTGYYYVVRLAGLNAATYTKDGLWCQDEESSCDILEVINNA